MSGGGERWRITHRIPTTIADVIDRYQRLQSISAAIDRVNDTMTPQDVARSDYVHDVRRLLTDMARHVPAPDTERRQALENIHAEPNTATWRGQSTDTLYRYWDETRKDLDHDIADVAGVELLLGMVRARDEIIADLDGEIIDLKRDIRDRDRRTDNLDQQVQRLDQDNMALADRLDRTGDQGDGDLVPATPANLPVPVIVRPTMPQIGGLAR